MPTCFLIDNGSLRAASTLSLRMIAARLERETGRTVTPVSLLHSNAVDPGELGGVPAEILEPALRRRLEAGERDFLILPLFFGPSFALTRYLPKRLAAIGRNFPRLNVRVASCLAGEREDPDPRLAEILRDRVLAKLGPDEKPPVILVDHGSPAPAVVRVRDRVAERLGRLLEGRIGEVVAASMERRPGDEYRFADPLLEDVLRRDFPGRGRVILAMMFLSPGRHAGEEGDVAAICRAAAAERPGLQTVRTDLVGDHPELIAILADRLHAALETFEP